MNNANDKMFEFLAQRITRWDFIRSKIYGKAIGWFYKIKNGGKCK